MNQIICDGCGTRLDRMQGHLHITREGAYSLDRPNDDTDLCDKCWTNAMTAIRDARIDR